MTSKQRTCPHEIQQYTVREVDGGYDPEKGEVIVDVECRLCALPGSIILRPADINWDDDGHVEEELTVEEPASA